MAKDMLGMLIVCMVSVNSNQMKVEVVKVKGDVVEETEDCDYGQYLSNSVENVKISPC